MGNAVTADYVRACASAITCNVAVNGAYLHVKSGGMYVVTGVQLDTDGIGPRVSYVCLSTHAVYSRTLQEFSDGRFRRVIWDRQAQRFVDHHSARG